MEASELIQELLNNQKLAVLSTRDGNQPYCNLVCFTATKNLDCLVFATSRATRKYANLSQELRVALLVDDRANKVSDIEKATAITAIGTAWELSGREKADFLGIYINKHPRLESFVSSADTALFKIKVDMYIVSKFLETQVIKMEHQA